VDVFSTEMGLLVARAQQDPDMAVFCNALAVGPHGRHFGPLLAQHLVGGGGGAF
jgi:hypothetical protein